MAGMESSALDALLVELESTDVEEQSTDVEEQSTPLAGSTGSTESNGHKKHRSKSKTKKKKRKKEKKAKQPTGASWMPWGADGVARSVETSDEEEEDDDRESPEGPPESGTLAEVGVPSAEEEDHERNAQEEQGEQNEAEPSGAGADLLESEAASVVPQPAVAEQGQSLGLLPVKSKSISLPPALAGQPRKLPSPQAGLFPPPLLAGSGGPSSGPPVRVHPDTIAALPHSAAEGLPAPPPLVLKQADPAPPQPSSGQVEKDAPAASEVQPSTAPEPARVEPCGRRAATLQPGGNVRPELSPGAQPLRAGTPAARKTMLLGSRSSKEDVGAGSETSKEPGTKRRLFRSLSRKHFKAEASRQAQASEDEAQPSRSRTDGRETRRRTLNLGSPRDEIEAEKKPKKKGVVRSLSAKGLNFVGKKKDSFATLAPFVNTDNNELCWANVQPSSPTNEMMEAHLRSFVSDVDSFNYECGAVEATNFQRKLVVEQQHIDIKFFEEYFDKTKYDTYVARNVEHPWVLAMTKVKSLKKILVYINNGETIYRLSCDVTVKPKEVLAQIPKYSSKLADARFELVKGCTTYPDILRLEQFDHRPQYTVGVLYCAEGQTTEAEMYNNECGSPEFDEFLSMLGDKIELKGWPRYPGGLDVARNKTGTHALYTMLRQYEVMYHVSTMLPYDTNDEQKIERKRHIGNDMVVVIFKEGSQKIDPKCFASHFNFVFVIVERVPPEESGESGIVYSVEFCYAKTAPAPARPALPSPAFLKAGSRSRDLLVTKLMNAERMCLCANEFQEKLRRTKRHMIDFMVERYFRN